MIAFVSTRDGSPYPTWQDTKAEIYLMNADGTAVTRLTNDTALDIHPAFSPDGKSIVFASNRDTTPYSQKKDIYTMSATGTGITRLTHGEGDNGEPTFSPDGKSIVFERGRDWGDQADEQQRQRHPPDPCLRGPRRRTRRARLAGQVTVARGVCIERQRTHPGCRRFRGSCMFVRLRGLSLASRLGVQLWGQPRRREQRPRLHRRLSEGRRSWVPERQSGQAKCETQCEYSLAQACPGSVGALYDCVLGFPLHCSKEGEAAPDTTALTGPCLPQVLATVRCKACVVDSNDGACGACRKASCCTEIKAIYEDPASPGTTSATKRVRTGSARRAAGTSIREGASQCAK